jgi:hypothetical protein
MGYSREIKIEPFEGKNYKNSSPKILILGMSEWGREFEGDRKRSIEYINGIKNEEYPHQYFTKVFNTFHLSHHNDRRSFWDDVCFYNYIQEVMAIPQQYTPKRHWESAETPFWEVVNKLNPDIIIVTGFETYKHLPNGDGQKGKTFRISEGKMETWEYDINNKRVIVCKTHHPAFHGYKTDVWRKLFLQFFNNYKKRSMVNG